MSIQKYFSSVVCSMFSLIRELYLSIDKHNY
jgi:hypothetical protein